MDILDVILGAEMANEYTDSQRLAYTEKKVLTYDGNPDNRFPWGDEGVYMTRVSGELIDLNSIAEITLTPAVGDPIVVKATPETTFVGTLPGSSFPCLYGRLSSSASIHAPAIALLDIDLPGTDFGDLYAGTYLCSYENEIMVGYISRIECAETVHQIDQKFIPNTVINLCDYGIDSYQILQIAMGTGKLEGRIPADYETLERLFDAVPADGTPLAVMINNGKDPIIMCYNPVVGINPSGASVSSLSASATLVEENLGKRIDMTILIQNSNAVRSIYYFIEINDKPADVTL